MGTKKGGFFQKDDNPNTWYRIKGKDQGVLNFSIPHPPQPSLLNFLTKARKMGIERFR